METMATKRCSRCKQEKPVTEFNKNRRAKDGLYYYCRECHRAHLREYRTKNAARNPDEVPIPPEKRCPGCGVTRPSSEWHRNRAHPDGLEVYCKPCRSERVAKYRAENPEKVREDNRRWKKANPDKHREHVSRWRKANPDKVLESARRWRESNPDKARESYRRWAKANPDKVLAKHHRRRARKAGAFTEPHTHEDLIVFTRDYLGLDPEKCFYCFLEGRDSPSEHVDHVIPLAKGGSETVWNKRFACAKCNISKGSKVWAAGQPMDLESERIVAEQYLATRRWMVHKGLLNPAG